jgi:aspartokinase
MKSSVHVLKFGGTSVGNGERIRHVATIVAHYATKSEEDFPVVVVSAMAGVTDQLLRIAHYSSTGQDEDCELELSALKQKHREAAEKAVHKRKNLLPLQRELEAAFKALERDVDALRALAEQEVPLYTAAVAAWGERLSVLLLAAAVRDMRAQATAVREEVIITSQPEYETTRPFGPAGTVLTVARADPLPAETRARAEEFILPLIEQRSIPIVAGFIGRIVNATELSQVGHDGRPLGSPHRTASSPAPTEKMGPTQISTVESTLPPPLCNGEGMVTTLGRNGSDYSAAVIGAALDCVEVSIYTDVDGVLSADPRVVANTRLLPRLSYAEAARLSWFGAKVLHPRTLIPVAHRNIPVRVRNTFRPHTRGTVVGPDGKQHSAAAAITVRRQLALITVESTDMFGAPENAGQVFALASRAGAAPVAICSSSGHHLSFMVDEQAAHSVVSLLQHDMGRESGGLTVWRVLCRSGLAACACIGSGFTVDPMSSARAITALARERIPVITQGASELGIILIVEDQDSESALRCLHRDLIAPVIPLVRHEPQTTVGTPAWGAGIPQRNVVATLSGGQGVGGPRFIEGERV